MISASAPGVSALASPATDADALFGRAAAMETSRHEDTAAENTFRSLFEGEVPAILNLSKRGMGPKELYCIAPDIASTVMVTSLDLSENKLGDHGSTTLAAVLVHQKSLQSIFLRNTNITDMGVEAIAKGLLSNVTLTNLDLSSNGYIGFIGTEYVARSLDVNTSICRICLGESYEDRINVYANSPINELEHSLQARTFE